jgi:hypothetical protein
MGLSPNLPSLPPADGGGEEADREKSTVRPVHYLHFPKYAFMKF